MYKELAGRIGHDIAIRLQQFEESQPEVVPPELLTVEEAADCLKVSVSQVQKMVAADALPYMKIGRLVRFDPERLRQWWLVWWWMRTTILRKPIFARSLSQVTMGSLTSRSHKTDPRNYAYAV